MQFSLFLKRVLLLDAASCLGMGLVLVVGAGALAGPTGLSAALLGAAGLFLLPFGLFLVWLGTRANGLAALVWLVIVGNIAWSIESLVLAYGGGLRPLGIAFVAAQAAAVLGLAALEYVGLRRSRAAAA